MKIQILGCNGGVGQNSASGLGTTSLLLGEHILIDAGSGLEKLSIKAMQKIKYVFLTHAHLDHISALPTFLGNLFGVIQEPVQIYAPPQVLDTLKRHIFNWHVWPDFTELPSKNTPIMQYQELKPWQPIKIEEYRIEAFPVVHSVPTVGYSVRSKEEHFVFSGDTKATAELVQTLNALGQIDTFMVECAFPDHAAEIAEASYHLTPSALLHLLAQLKKPPREIWVTHLKPSYAKELRHTFATEPAYQDWKILSSHSNIE